MIYNKERKSLQQMLLGQFDTIWNQSKFYLKSYTKINPSGIVGLNKKVKTIKLLEYNIIVAFKQKHSLNRIKAQIRKE